MNLRASRIPRLFGAQAIAFAPWVLIVPERAGDRALIAHEQVHFDEQQAMGRWRWCWRYLTAGEFRLLAEVRAYRAQLALNQQGLERIATALPTLYRLRITRDEARELIPPGSSLTTPTR